MNRDNRAPFSIMKTARACRLPERNTTCESSGAGHNKVRLRLGSVKQTVEKDEGSAMVESALVFPIIILSAMFTVYMMINYYSEGAQRARLHEELRDRAAVKTGATELTLTETGAPNIFREKAESGHAEYSEGGGLLAPYLSVNAAASYEGGLLTRRNRIERVFTSRAYLIDEEKGLWAEE